MSKTVFSSVFVVGIIISFLFVSCNSNSQKISDDRIKFMEDSIVNYILNTPPQFEVFSDILAAEYETNEIAADNKYFDKVIIVEGLVDEIKKDMVERDKVSIHLGRGGIINCHLNKVSHNLAANLKPGELIKVKGICKGSRLYYIDLHTSIIMK